VAFSTSASNLTGGVADVGTVNLVRRDRETSGNKLISADADGDGIGGDRAMLSEDGNRLVFWSFGADITPGDGNGIWDIFVYQHDKGSYRRVSKPSSGERDQGTESSSRVVSPAISGDGHFVAFATTAAKLVAGDTNELQDVFVVDLDGSKGVRRVSVGPSGEQGDGNSPAAQGERVALSYDGRWVAFTSSATNFGAVTGNMYLRDLDTDELRVITDFTYGVGTPSLSRGAAYLAFGAADKLDTRFESTGLFAHFTGIADAFYWVR
jgi:Tol biopolymer transport system component